MASLPPSSRLDKGAVPFLGNGALRGMTDLTYTAQLPAGPDYPIAGTPYGDLELARDGTEGPETPVMPAPAPPGFPEVPALPDDSDEGPLAARGEDSGADEPGI
jgi:hypothetical protein